MKLNVSVFRTMMLSTMLLVGLAVEARVISGTVKDPTGETIISASVVVKGTTIGTVTDFDGNYSLDVPDDAKVLIFSYIGMQTQEVEITGDVLNVVLSENSEVLDEVVVTGYGTTKKRDLVTAVASVSAEQLKDIPVASASEALQGKLAGVQVTTTEGSPDADVKVRVRGGTSITQSNDPLYIVDGFPVSSISDIAPTDIASMDVLKGAAATAIYGAQGANGVIIITTKESDTDSDKMTFHLDYNGYVGWKKLANRLDNLDNRDFLLMQYENFYLKGQAGTGENDFPAWVIKDYVKGTSYNPSTLINGANDLERTDWLDETFGRTGFVSNHSVSVNGGNKNAQFTLSYNRMDDKAIMQESDYARNNLSLKAKFKPFKNFTIGFTTRYTDTKVNGAGSNATKDAGTSSESRLRNSFAYTPIKLYKKDSDSLDDEDAVGGLYDPLTTIRDNYKYKEDVKWNVQGYLSYKFLKHFTLRSEIGYEARHIETDRFYGKTTYEARANIQPIYGNETTEGVITDQRASRFRQTNTFNWNQTFASAHNVNLTVGEEILMMKGETKTEKGAGFPSTMLGKEVFQRFGSAQDYTTTNYINPTDNMLSIFARADYNYKGRYYVSGTFRADASTRFSSANQWGFFPAGAIGWNIAEEDWMEPARVCLSQLKLRFDYGMAGNNNVDLGYLHTDFLPQVTSNSAASWVNNMPTMLIAGGSEKIAANPNLKWETTITRNLGLDYGFFNQRLSGSLDLYLNSTKDLIIKYPISGGYNWQYRNIGSTRNMGIEFSVNAVILDERSADLNYNLTVSANISSNKNTVTDLGLEDDQFIEIGTNGFSSKTFTPNEFRLVKGQAVGNFYGYQVEGWYHASDFASVTPSMDSSDPPQNQKATWTLKDGVPSVAVSDMGNPYPGMQRLKDTNGDGKINSEDITVIGNALPKASGGFSINFNIGGRKWGKADLALNFTYSIGNDVLNMNKIDFTTILNNTNSTSFRNMLSLMAYGQRYSMFDENGNYLVDNLVSANGGNYDAAFAELDAMNSGATIWSPYMQKYVLTDWAIEDGSFLRLNQLTVGYSLAEDWIKKAYIQKLRIYFQVSNVFCATKYSGFDPEVDVYSSKNPMMMGVDYSAYPKSRGYNIGLNLSF
ncbi:MAG: TonB-dependent receptor [Paludibacteraceae bacterium]|nr:TonB-dependent receptor [Paludibacteraceae bacterium]